MTRVTLPDPLYRTGPKINDVDPAAMRRVIAELSRLLTGMQQTIDVLSQAVAVADNITRPPSRIGQTAVVGTDVYIATGLDVADWVLVS